jgi:ribosomal protein S18 acetylase RimI-like enzyme
VLELVATLSPAAREALADLERRTIAADGGRLKLEWGVLAEQKGDDVHDVLWWEAQQLLGFIGLYVFGGASAVELAGMVDPAVRRRGIATALLDAALPVCRDRGYTKVLLVTPRNAAGGREFALARGAVLDHSEHALVLRGAPSSGLTDPAITLRRATPGDAEVVARQLEMAFGRRPIDLDKRFAAPEERTLLVERDGVAIGTVRLTRDRVTGGIYGFAIDPSWRGRGVGRDVLRRCCLKLLGEGAQQVQLEVAVDNERALGLYTSVGFQRVMTEDYYAVEP